MPRRRPALVRLDQPDRSRAGHSRADIPGLSRGTLAAIARIERRTYEPGAAYDALEGWRALVHGRGPRVIYPDFSTHYPCCEPAWGGDHRRPLEEICHALPRRAARELRALLAPLDARFIARTLNDPYAPAGDPWWRRRLETA